MKMEFKPGMPDKDGWYLVKLDTSDNDNGQTHGVDYCRSRSPSDGGGREWLDYYQHGITGWCELPTGD